MPTQNVTVKCQRCWRDSYKVKIGLVVVLVNDKKVQVPVCEPHINEILKWLQVSTGKNMIKLPRQAEEDSLRQTNLYENQVKEITN